MCIGIELRRLEQFLMLARPCGIDFLPPGVIEWTCASADEVTITPTRDQ
jgi:hypothetical protein